MRTLALLGMIGMGMMTGMATPPDSLDRFAEFLEVEAADLARPEKTAPNLSFQTASRYDPRIDLRTDRVIVHGHGSPPGEIAATLESWQDAGHDVISMFFVSSDAGRHFEEGRVTGEPRPDIPERTSDGRALRIEGHRAYMFPDTDWIAYIEELIEHAIRNGARGIMPEEPFGHAQTGYEEAYKRKWEELTGEAWVPPHQDLNTFWRSARFKGDVFHRTIAGLARHTREIAESEERDVRFILPIHSILSNLAGGRIFPNVRSLGIEELDGYVAQVWQGPVLWSLGNLEGERHDGFFESALGLYGTFAELARNTDKEMHFLVDPVEDDPNRSWETYRRNYEMCVVAMLHYGGVDKFEVMPWPDRIFLPGHTTGGGTPGPADYRTALIAMTRVFDEMPRFEADRPDNDQGVGVLISDTASWEVHGPENPGMEPFHGLFLPLTTRGVLTRLPWLERVVEQEYLDPFKVVLLSYDHQKPANERIHEGLLRWVRNGGHLVVFGGDSPYNAVDGWWRERGYDGPAEALVGAAGLEPPATSRERVGRLSVTGGGDHELPGKPEIRVYGDSPEDTLVAGPNGETTGFSVTVGDGRIHFVGTPADLAARHGGGAAFVLDVVRAVGREAGMELRESDVFRIRRGPYEAAFGLRGRHVFEGTFIDLFDHRLPVVVDPVVDPGEAALFYRPEESDDGPALLFTTHRLVFSGTSADSAGFLIEGPLETNGAVRVASPAGEGRIREATAIDAEGKAVPVRHHYDPDQSASLVEFPNHPNGVAVRLRWK